VNKKVKPKLDRWFLIVLAIILWTLCSQMFNLTSALAFNWTSFNLWCRVIACGIAIYGDIWVLRIYISGAIREAKRKEKQNDTKVH